MRKDRRENAENLYYAYEQLEEAIPNVWKGDTVSKIVERLLNVSNLTQEKVDVEWLTNKIQDDIELDAVYDELDEEGIDY